MFKSLVKYIAFVQIFLLIGCSSIPITSLPKLMALDLESMNMSQIELAVRVQDNVGLQKGSAQLEVSLNKAKTKENLSHTLVLETPDEGLTPFLRRQIKSGYKIHRFKISPEQAEAAELFRQKALTLKSKNKNKTDMTLSARVYFCEYRDLDSYENISMTFFVRTNSRKDFFKLFKQQDLTFSEADRKNHQENPIYCD